MLYRRSRDGFITAAPEDSVETGACAKIADANDEAEDENLSIVILDASLYLC